MNGDRRAQWEGAALIAYGVVWLTVAGLIAVVIRLEVPDPEELLRDVADRRALWIGANALLIVQQVLLVLVIPALARVVGPGTVAADAVRGLLALAGGAFVASGVIHGVLGAHLADKVTSGPLDSDLVLSTELVHALADTFWFVGVGALTATTAVVAAAQWRHSGGQRTLAAIGAGAVACNLLQFGWFADHVFGVFAGPGALLQTLWLAGTGRGLRSPADGRAIP